MAAGWRSAAPPPKSVPPAIDTPAARAIRVLSFARSSWSAIFARPSVVANRAIVVVAPNVSHDFKTVSVLTSTQPRSDIIRATSPSSSNPCSMESMPAAAPTRAPDSWVEWAVTFAPRAWTA